MTIKTFIENITSYDAIYNEFAKKNKIIAIRMPEQMLRHNAEITNPDTKQPEVISVILIVSIVEFEPRVSI